MATYTKLKDGTWGIRVTGSVKTGDTVTVTKKSGERKVETVTAVLWTGDGISLCSISAAARPASSGSSYAYGRSSGGGRRKKCVTDGNCSSFGNGRSCGGYDCDGY